jgi:hypothetical protein
VLESAVDGLGGTVAGAGSVEVASTSAARFLRVRPSVMTSLSSAGTPWLRASMPDAAQPHATPALPTLTRSHPSAARIRCGIIASDAATSNPAHAEPLTCRAAGVGCCSRAVARRGGTEGSASCGQLANGDPGLSRLSELIFYGAGSRLQSRGRDGTEDSRRARRRS